MNEDFQAKAKSGRSILDTLASLKLTVVLLVLSMLLVLLGTLEQVHWGVWHIQKEYFSSWFCFYPMDQTKPLNMPLPGGFLIGALLIVNLGFAHFRHFKASVKHLGISMIHAGLLLLLAGGFVTAVYQEESAMVIPEGEQRNYSEAFREFEITVIEKTAGGDQVTAIPDALLRTLSPKNNALTLSGTPFTLNVQTYHTNAMLRAKSQMPEATEVKVSQGIGAKSALALKAQPESFDDNAGNSPVAIVELTASGKSLGNWILNPGISESFPAQSFVHDGKNYEIGFRRTRHYLPFTLKLNKFTHEKYPGTNTPRRFASDVTLSEGSQSLNYNISMNQPLRHAGLTFFQSSFGSTREGKDLSVLQVVRNPGAWIPYVSVGIMSLGLLWHFGFSLLRFLRGRAAKSAAILAFGLFALTGQAAEQTWNSQEFGNIPVQSGGRIVPLETLASGSLLQMRSRREIRLTDLERIAFGQKPSTWTAEQKKQIAEALPGVDANVQAALEKRPVRLNGNSMAAIDWLLEVCFRAQVARHLPTFRIEHPVVLKMVGRDIEKTFYASWDDILKNSEKVTEAAGKSRLRAQADRDAEDRSLLQLESAARQYATLSMTFIPGDLPAEIPPQREYEAWLSSLSRAVAEMNTNREKGGSGTAFDPELQKTVKSFVERYQDFQREGLIGLVPPKEVDSLEKWDNLGTALLSVIQDKNNHRQSLAADGLISRYATFCVAWREGNDDTCTVQARAIAASLQGNWSTKSNSEATFGRLQPFYWLLIAYVVTVLMIFGSWLTDSESLRNWAYRLLVACFVMHTLALGYRMWLHGRPPVTNLYSSGIFIAWGTVGLGIILERIWKNGIGAAATGIAGFVSLIVAHNLGLSGEDNLESVRAVLDSNFWLSTHVTIVTLGYSATFVAGMLAAMHLWLRAFKKDYSWGDSVGRAAYGILAFATLASFIGTMLGGIWADQSWGRFWGWDPKENGAILIVLWCAVCLHARWGALVRREGLMQMLVFGNIVTSWSWFGTNLLGVGLHSYGFTESGFFWLTAFWITQIVIIALGWLPARASAASKA